MYEEMTGGEMFGMKLAGKKVILRAAGAQDGRLLQELIHDPETRKVTGGYRSAGPFIPQMDWFGSGTDASGVLRRIIADQTEKETGLGIILLSHVEEDSGAAEIYIKLVREARGRGYGQDAVEVLLFWAFQKLGLGHVCANILEHNTASLRLFEACGFRRERTQKTRADREGYCRTVYGYGLDRERWRTLHGICPDRRCGNYGKNDEKSV